MEQFKSFDSYGRIYSDEHEVMRFDRIDAYSDYIRKAIRDSEMYSEDAYKHANVILFTY